MVRRNFIFKTVREVFEKYGYLPIETPAMENLETLMGKYGEEGDKLIFRIFPRGRKINDLIKLAKNVGNKNSAGLFAGKNEFVDDPSATKDENFDATMANIFSSHTTEEALRYDLTVPFARYVVQHQNEIIFPFKRYQIQPVWRADRPQKGRYREFYQCDADVIGSNSLLNEVEIVQMIDDVFTLLKIPVTIKINNRKILSGISEVIGEKERIVDITVAIDKLDKIGIEGVNKELQEKGISTKAIEKIQPLIHFKGNLQEKMAFLKGMLSISETGKKGIEEIEFIFNNVSKISHLTSHTSFDITLARGLSYYTGAIFEVKANNVQIGSICGGGRYDDLTGIFGLPNVSGVGISFGIDRIYDVMNELGLFQKLNLSETTTRVLLAHFGEAERNYCLPLASKLRAENINTEIYPDTVKIKKQFDYANKKQVPFVVVIGEEEMKSGKLTLKDMASGEQTKLSLEEIIEKIK